MLLGEIFKPFQKKANFGNDILANQSSNAKKLLKLENIYGGKFGDGILFDTQAFIVELYLKVKVKG